MSLTTCPDCSNDVSDEAPGCPHCGRPMGKQRVRTSEDSVWTRNRGCGDLVLYGGAVLVILLLLGLHSCGSAP
jgi:uncharacterized membrane protein YvbJ